MDAQYVGTVIEEYQSAAVRSALLKLGLAYARMVEVQWTDKGIRSGMLYYACYIHDNGMMSYGYRTRN